MSIFSTVTANMLPTKLLEIALWGIRRLSDTIREAILPCTLKLTSQLNLPHGTKIEKVKKRKTKKVKKQDMLRSIGKQSG